MIFSVIGVKGSENGTCITVVKFFKKNVIVEKILEKSGIIS